jgi:hypothetical protein
MFGKITNAHTGQLLWPKRLALAFFSSSSDAIKAT